MAQHPLTIRPATVADAQAIAELHVRAWQWAYKGLLPDAPPTTAEVMAIYLEPEAVGKGIGRALFTHAVEDLRQRGYQEAILWVLTNNQRARAFYEKAGWKPDGASKTEERPGAILEEVRYHLALR